MKKKSSFIWNHFTMVGQGTKATCHHCKKELSYTLTTMSNLGRHIKLRHPEVLTADETPMEVYTVEEIGQEQAGVELKSYEITVKGFEEMEDMDQSAQEETTDHDWTPESEGSWREQSASTPATSTPSQKKDRKRSAVWDHFQRSACKTNASCLHCGRVIRMGTISNLARHLRHKHPRISLVQTHELGHKPPSSVQRIVEKNENEDSLPKNEGEICSEVIELNVDSFHNPVNIIETKVYKNVYNEDINNGIITQSSQTDTVTAVEDFDMHDYIKPKESATSTERIDRLLVKMIVKGCHPVSMVEQNGFKEFVKALNPKYELPSLIKLTEQLIPEFYRECESRASRSLQEAEGVCLYIDQWKSRTITYMCVTAHFINKECKFEPLFLACHIVSEDENASDISQRLLETVTEWEISGKVVAVVTDNTKMMVDAVKIQNWVHIPHFIRSLCSVIHESLFVIKSIVIKVKNITDELKKSPPIIAEIYSKHKNLGHRPVKLITKVRNDCNSSFTTLEMLSRFTKLKSALMHVVHHVPEYKLSENEWKILKSVIDDVLEVFREVKEEVTKEGRVCMSKIVYFIKALQREMNKVKNSNSIPSDAICVATAADSLMQKHFQDFLASDLVSFLLLLDPRLKKYAFSDESEYVSACSQLKREVCQVTIPELDHIEPDPESLWYSFDQEIMKLNSVKDPIGKGILELENYLQEQLLERDKDPLVWWDQRKAIYPRLFKLVKKYLCVSTKYSQRESISYKTAYMLSQLKNSNSASSESELMFLHHNM